MSRIFLLLYFLDLVIEICTILLNDIGNIRVEFFNKLNPLYEIKYSTTFLFYIKDINCLGKEKKKKNEKINQLEFSYLLLSAEV